MKIRIIQLGMLIWVSMGLLASAQVDYAFITGTASVDIPNGPGLRANQNFEATITVRNQSANNGIPVSSFIRYELVPNTGPPVPLRWRVAEASPLIAQDRNIPGIAAAGTNFVLTTILNPPPGIAPGTYSLRAILDPNHLQNDNNRLNNTNVWPNSLTVLGTPDLTFRWPNRPEILSPAPNDLYQNGDQITVRIRYENVGDNVPVQPFDVDYYLLLPEMYGFAFTNSPNSSFYISPWAASREEHRIFLGSRTTPGIPNTAPPGPRPLYTFDSTFTLPTLPSSGYGEYVVGVWLNPPGQDQVVEQSYTKQFLGESVVPPLPNNQWFGGPVKFAHLNGQGADLRIRSGSKGVSPTSLAVGSAVMVTGRVENVGNQSAAATTMEHYLVRYDDSNQSPLPGQYLLGVTSIPALPAAVGNPPAIPVHNYMVPFTIPPTVPGGVYRYQSVIDPADLIPETNRLNNFSTLASSPITISGQSGTADLFTRFNLTNNAISPRTVNNRGHFTASIGVQNIGSGDAGPFSVRFSLQELSGSPDHPIVAPPSPPIGTLAVPGGLAAGVSTTLTASLQVPDVSEIPAGDYRLFWEVDFLDQVLEVNEDNNTGYFGWLRLSGFGGFAPTNRLRVVDPEAGLLPDLATEEMWVGTDQLNRVALIGEGRGILTFTNWIENMGTADSAAYTYSLYLTPDPDPSTTNWIGIAGRSMPALDAGHTAVDVFDVTLPDDFPVGTYYPVLVIDPNNNIEELQLRNNKKYYGDLPVVVTPEDPSQRPVLNIENFSAYPTTLLPGQPLAYEFVVQNTGERDLAGLMIEVGLSFNGEPELNLDRGDVVLKELGPFSIKGNDEYITVSGTLTFDEPTLDGYAHIVVWAINRQDPGVDTINDPIHIARVVNVRELRPRVAWIPGVFPNYYFAFYDASPGRIYKIETAQSIGATTWSPLAFNFPPGDPSTAIVHGPFSVNAAFPGSSGFWRMRDVTPEP